MFYSIVITIFNLVPNLDIFMRPLLPIIVDIGSPDLCLKDWAS